MGTEKSLQPIFYVYELICPKTLKPFYVGKGQDKRMYHHYFRVKNNKKIHNWKLQKILKSLIKENLKPIYNKIIETIPENEAYNLEEYYIKKYLDMGVKLTNMSIGGKNSLSGIKKTKEHKKKIGLANRGRKLSKEARLNMSEGQKLYFKDHSGTRKGMITPEKTKIKQRIARKRYCKTHDVWNKGIKKSEEQKKKISNSVKLAMKKPEIRQKYLINNKIAQKKRWKKYYAEK